MKKLYMNLQDFNSHAHVERDNFWGMERLNRNNFNSHAHVERDRPNTKRFLRLQISTHTLTWSVTIYAVMKCIYVQDFNSHAHVERDPAPNQNSSPATQFQLTRSRGAWPVDYRCLTYAVYLNSHANVESDSMPIEQQNAVMNFNSHAHVERDLAKCGVRSSTNAFQLTRSRGAWPIQRRYKRRYHQFQLTRSRGAWLKP